MSLSRRAAWLLLCAGATLGAVIAWRIPELLVDELHYGPQVRVYMEGRFDFDPLITMIPTYHLIVAGIAKLFGSYSDRLARLVSLAGSLALFPLAARVAASRERDAWMRGAQAFFNPLLFPYLFLIYTDGWSTAVYLALVLLTVRRRFGAAAVVGAFGIALRQDFAIWVAMAWAMAAWVDAQGKPVDWRAVPVRAVSAFPYAIVLAGFAAFVAWNGGIAVGDRSRHGSTINLSNAYLMLAYAWVLFLPFNVLRLREVLAIARRPVVMALVAAGFALYWLTYANPHPYNQFEPAYLRFFVHNQVLHAIDMHAPLRAALFVPMAWMALAAVVAVKERPVFAIAMGFGVLSAVLHPLIEPRYYLPAFLLFTCWRPALPVRVERATLAVYVAAALLLLYGTSSVRFFL